jgi:hypothetical protein
LVIFSVSLFFTSCLLFPRFPETYEVHKEKKIVKTKLKYVIPTFFTCFVQILIARTERSFLFGWSDPRLTLGTEPCAKVGSLQLNSVFARGQIDRRAMRNLVYLGHLFERQGDREGDGNGDLCLSCTLHLPALQVAIEAL